MAREVHKFVPEDCQTVNGYWTGSFQFFGTIRQVIIKPNTVDTTFNFGIVDETGMVIYRRQGLKGLFIDPEDSTELGLIVFPGEKRLIIEQASKDEMFDLRIIYQL